MSRRVKVIGHVCLVVTSSWAICSSKSEHFYDKLSYSFFLSSGAVGLITAVTEDEYVEKEAESGTERSHLFGTSLLSTEVCLVAGLTPSLAYSNLILPVINLIQGNRRGCERMVSVGLWYSSVLLGVASYSRGEVRLCFLLPLCLLLGHPKTTSCYPYLMTASILLARATLGQIKQALH